MKLLFRDKDGGQESTVWGYWVIEAKHLFSVALLKFVGRSREAFHTHAFDSISWVLRGQLTEHERVEGFITTRVYGPSLKPVITRRTTFHKVDSDGTTWVFTLRGPWAKTWNEFLPEENRFRTLASGRVEVA